MQTKLFMQVEFILSLLFVAVAVAKHITERLLLSNMHQPITISFHSPFHTSFLQFLLVVSHIHLHSYFLENISRRYFMLSKVDRVH